MTGTNGKLVIRVFGKAGCPKCKILQDRLEDVLNRPDWRDRFEKEYVDVETEEGIVAFCKAECLNPQRIPAFLILKRDPQTGRMEPVPNPSPGKPDPVCGSRKLYQYFGLQTDYSEVGKGILTKAMIEAVLAESLASAS